MAEQTFERSPTGLAASRGPGLFSQTLPIARGMIQTSGLRSLAEFDAIWLVGVVIIG
jgi:hypothetical protein